MLCACRVKQGDARAEQTALLETSLVSPQAMESAFGVDSVQAKAASQAMLQLLQVVQKLLSDAFNGRYEHTTPCQLLAFTYCSSLMESLSVSLSPTVSRSPYDSC